MSRKIKPAKMDELELERVRQQLDEFAEGMPNYGEPLSAKYRKKARDKKKASR